MEIRRMDIRRFKHGRMGELQDEVAVEEALEIVIQGSPFALNMRLPGRDIELVLGYCYNEGIIESADDVASLGHDCGTNAGSRVNVSLRDRRGLDRALEKKQARYVSQSSSGLGGRARLEEVLTDAKPVPGRHAFPAQELLGLKQTFESRMRLFPRTGCTHAAALFDRKGRPLAFAEDIGRHNALDKVTGSVLQEDALRHVYLALVSSRLSFEMVQKAARIGVEVLAGVSAATSMAADLARESNLTLIGFLRDIRMNIYTHSDRITA
jgi:FdhD protein